MVKEHLRRSFIKRRLFMSQEDIQKRSFYISMRLREIISHLKPKAILGFWPIKKEPQLWSFFQELNKEGIKLLLPAVAKGGLLLFEFRGILKRGPFGTLEPEGLIAKEPSDLELAIVPGICFDLRGYRLGYGGGYYDRFLKLVRAPKIGVCFDEELIQELEYDSWDERVDMVITEKRTSGGLTC
ncbi:MAG: 5-formyltetrahydrofolate cyclo-ligase [Aquificaceae bacterium]